MTLVWLIAFLGLLVVEFLTVGLVSIWFAIGALGALVTTFFTDSVIIQSIIFVVLSIVSLILTRPIIKKFKAVQVIPTNLDRVIGKIGEVTKEIEPLEYGEVKILGNYWTACSDVELKVGTRVKVKKIEGSKLIVEKEGE